MALPGHGRAARRARRPRPLGVDGDAHLRRRCSRRPTSGSCTRWSPRCGPSCTSTPHASSGLSDLRIIGRHVLSVVRAPIIIQTAILAIIAIAIQSGLEFLGLGDTSVPTWGGMLNDAFSKIYQAPLLMLWPSLAIALTCIALMLLANAIRDVLERTVVVRRKRRRAVTTATGSVAAVTTAVSASTDLGDRARHRHPRRRARSGTTTTSRQPSARPEVVLSVQDLRVGYGQSDGSTLEVVHGVSLRHPQGRGARTDRRVRLGQVADGLRRARAAPQGRQRHRRHDRLRGHAARERQRCAPTRASAGAASATSRRSR